MKNPIKKMLRTHKEYCMIVESKILAERSCTCGRDHALRLYEDIEGFLINMSEWLEDGDSRIVSNSAAHKQLDDLITRLV